MMEKMRSSNKVADKSHLSLIRINIFTTIHIQRRVFWVSHSV